MSKNNISIYHVNNGFYVTPEGSFTNMDKKCFCFNDIEDLLEALPKILSGEQL
jgi:hypothetical protein